MLFKTVCTMICFTLVLKTKRKHEPKCTQTSVENHFLKKCEYCFWPRPNKFPILTIFCKVFQFYLIAIFELRIPNKAEWWLVQDDGIFKSFLSFLVSMASLHQKTNAEMQRETDAHPKLDLINSTEAPINNRFSNTFITFLRHRLQQ